MPDPVVLGGVILVPTFVSVQDPLDPDPVVQASRRMYRDGNFLYDGWVPLDRPDMAPTAIAELEERFGVLALTGPHSMRWRPKYVPGGGDVYYHLEPERAQRATELARAIAALSPVDAEPVRTALASLAMVYRIEDPAARLVFAVTAVETIDRSIQGAPSGSIFAGLASTARKHHTRVIAVLEGAIGPEHPTVRRLRTNPGRLRRLRNDVAHGRADPMSPRLRAVVAADALQAAYVARIFIGDRLARALGTRVDATSPDQVFVFEQGAGVSVGSRSAAVTHMALLYA